MRTDATAGEKEIQTTGFFVFSALTLIVALLKLAAFSDWAYGKQNYALARAFYLNVNPVLD